MVQSIHILLCCLILPWTAAFLSFPTHSRPRSSSLRSFSPRTEAIFHKVAASQQQSGGAGGSTTLDGLRNLNNAWLKLKDGGWKDIPPAIVFDESSSPLSSEIPIQYDLCVSGGTLGIFYAAALQTLGYKTCIVERGQIVGRSQEWNISRKELNALIRLGLMTQAEIDSIVGIEFNPNRVGFKTDTSSHNGNDMTDTTGFQVYVNDVLNLGIKPDVLIALMKDKYVAMGGTLYEGQGLKSITLYSNVAQVNLTSGTSITSKLVVDAMGNASPISKQIRGPVEPDGICVVVGTCARGFDAVNNTYSDVIYTDTPITTKIPSVSNLQYFWEAFPAGSGPLDRTTYLFTYMDAQPERPSIAEIMEDYWELLPRYQGKSVEDLEFLRVLYGMFPTYRSSPVQTTFPRILAVGDASGIQSPLSFGGFGSLTRHIERVVGAMKEALDEDLLSADMLAQINPYQPNLSACWMFQRAMSCRIGSSPKPGLIVGTLSNSFSAMKALGPDTMNPFLQDVLQFFPLLRTLLLAAKQDLLTPVKVLPQVGLVAMGDFIWHFMAMWIYTLLANSLGPLLASSASSLPSPAWRFTWKRTAEAWKYGSGLDYYDHE